MSSEKLPDIKLVLASETIEFNTLLNVPKYYGSFMTNLKCTRTDKEGIWHVDTEYVDDVQKFLKTCNVNSGFAGYVKREWTENVRRRRAINKILSFVTAEYTKYAEIDDLDKLDVIVNLLSSVSK